MPEPTAADRNLDAPPDSETGYIVEAEMDAAQHRGKITHKRCQACSAAVDLTAPPPRRGSAARDRSATLPEAGVLRS